jgi:hypothetical protein
LENRRLAGGFLLDRMIAAGAEEVAENMKQQQAEAEQTAVDETHD